MPEKIENRSDPNSVIQHLDTQRNQPGFIIKDNQTLNRVVVMYVPTPKF